MSFIQKLIERKTQATGSMASEHAVDEDLSAQEDGISMVDIVDLDEPDAPVQAEDQSPEAMPEPTNNVLSLTDPFAIGDELETADDIGNLPDLEANFEEEAGAEALQDAEQNSEAPASLGDMVDADESDDIDADDEAFNIWDVEMEEEELKTPAPEKIQAVNTATPEPKTPPVRAFEPVNEDKKPQTPQHTPEPAPEATPDAASDVAEPRPTEPAAPITVAKAEPVAPVSPPVAPPAPAAAPPQQAEAPQQAPAKRRVGRVKTRLLGFEHASKPGVNLFDRSTAAESEAETTTEKVAQVSFPVGWLVVVEGPGHGEAFALHAGMSQIGRGEDQAVQLDFGDETISRDNHAAIVYDVETHTFLMGHGGKANVVRLNGKPLICTEEVKNSDMIKIGKTTLRLVALCSTEFNWEDQNS